MRIDYEQLEFIHPLLRKLLRDLEDWMTELPGEEPTITSQFRIDDDGVHGTLPLRGTDIRCRDHALGNAAEEYLNGRWQYDPDRPFMVVCKYHSVVKNGKSLGWHLHLQVHPRSIRDSL